MIRKLFASNFRSLGEGVEIPLGQGQRPVGQNAAGKSSIIDLIRFLRDAVQQNAEQALSVRGACPASSAAAAPRMPRCESVPSTP